ncbi:DUF2190 family protein [Desulfonatronovibrio hydrogenovorans]|uniref:DUF2190 family protein n=1 Tax=Desulfonatronovibrio hydrogenovorans TaxID=53245 RepID=UPI00048DB1DA|nr:capsid cement protein [Desulfonatronovibrio hydrogenovorans]
MATNYRYEGRVMDITAGTDLKSGELVIVGDIAAVCITDIDNTKKGSAAIENVWELDKEADPSGKELDQGKKVYWNATTGKVSNTPGSEPELPCIGIAYEDAASAATTCLIKINVGI